MHLKNLHITVYKIMVLVAFAGIIFCPAIAFSGALSGLKLWAVVVLPGLFPALIITTCILALFPMSKTVSYLYVMGAGVFCGFPIGSILCGQLHAKNSSEKICDKIMAYCNLSSPSFVMNYIIYSSINGRYPVFPTLLCIYLPVIELYAFCLIRYRKDIFPDRLYKNNRKQLNTVHSITMAQSYNSNNLSKNTNAPSKKKLFTNRDMVQILDNSIWSSIKSMLKLCGYIVVFSCLAAYICKIPIHNDMITAIICGITEITNGIYLLCHLPLDARLITLLIVTVNATGGISTLMQTAGMTTGTGVSIKKYIYHKLIFTLVTLVNSLFIIYVLRF